MHLCPGVLPPLRGFFMGTKKAEPELCFLNDGRRNQLKA